jgi:methyltransferase (TIGR00027 family)
MRDSVPSRTVLRVALRRAAHQALDSPKVLDDPLAVRIVAAEAAEIYGNRSKHQARAARHFRAFMVVRSKYAEDQLEESVAHGVSQYLILGAGLDTSAYRATAAKNMQVFEIDHPNTQAWKMERLRAAEISIPEFVRFVSLDFERKDLATELRRAGFHADQPTFVSSLGVVPYLTKEAAAHIWLSRQAAGGERCGF